MSTTFTDRRPGGKLVAATATRLRRPPTPRHLARRHLAITLVKWVLPALALALLSSIALWPEFNRATEEARAAFRRVSAEVQGGQLIDARYHGIDDKGRPYTITAATAQQDGPGRINLTMPKGDISFQDGTWLMLHSRQGVFMQQLNELDMSRDVTLYRDDGTTMVTASAAIDLKNGAAAGAQPVHAEGPFGTLDAVGFTLVDKGANIQFGGPAHLVLNGTTVGAAAPAAATANAPPAPPVMAPPLSQSGLPRGHAAAAVPGAEASR